MKKNDRIYFSNQGFVSLGRYFNPRSPIFIHPSPCLILFSFFLFFPYKIGFLQTVRSGSHYSKVSHSPLFSLSPDSFHHFSLSTNASLSLLGLLAKENKWNLSRLETPPPSLKSTVIQYDLNSSRNGSEEIPAKKNLDSDSSSVKDWKLNSNLTTFEDFHIKQRLHSSFRKLCANSLVPSPLCSSPKGTKKRKLVSRLSQESFLFPSLIMDFSPRKLADLT